MDKSQIINEIKLHLKIKTDSQFADFLGVKQPTISSWRNRNTLDYELIIAKCNIFNAEWLITGKGEPLKKKTSTELNIDYKELTDVQWKLLKLKEKVIENLNQEIHDLKEDKKFLSDAINKIKSAKESPEQQIEKE